MKTAKIKWVAFEVICPHCGADIAEPNSGSYLWNIHEGNEETVRCPECDNIVRLPKNARP